eukprot:TRINITY_DN4643_c0_g1_i1.p2 TRINITY_DN4643_c0_g1~~TRINITY_DN4643_c0_g1_i1.p2  ORF type:complete len:54 (+),score=33.08 TRINITY_DN4643_c0_g1_i1:350-511(+)
MRTLDLFYKKTLVMQAFGKKEQEFLYGRYRYFWKKKKYRLRGRSSETAKAHRG